MKIDKDLLYGTRSKTDPEKRRRCPKCLSLNVEPKTGDRVDIGYRCRECLEYFDDPYVGTRDGKD